MGENVGREEACSENKPRGFLWAAAKAPSLEDPQETLWCFRHSPSSLPHYLCLYGLVAQSFLNT